MRFGLTYQSFILFSLNIAALYWLRALVERVFICGENECSRVLSDFSSFEIEHSPSIFYNAFLATFETQYFSFYSPRLPNNQHFLKGKTSFYEKESSKSVFWPFWHFWLISIGVFLTNQKEIIVNQISKKCFLINHPISEYLSNISRDSIYQTVMPNMHTDGYFNNL